MYYYSVDHRRGAALAAERRIKDMSAADSVTRSAFFTDGTFRGVVNDVIAMCFAFLLYGAIDYPRSAVDNIWAIQLFRQNRGYHCRSLARSLTHTHTHTISLSLSRLYAVEYNFRTCDAKIRQSTP